MRSDVNRIDANSEVYNAQIDRLYHQTPMVLIVNVVNSTLVAAVLASYLGQTPWLIFLVLTLTLTGMRLIGWNRYYARSQLGKATTKYAIVAVAGSGLSGILWGAGSALLLPDNLVEQTFVAFVIGGMCVASLISFSYYIPAFVAYVFPAVLPLAGRFFWDGWPVHGDMMVVFAVTITIAAFNSARGFATGLRLNFELTERTRELTTTNSLLEMEIAQRGVAEDQLRQAHKMEAIGQLTGGIAHDFNNLLTALVGDLEMAEARINDDPQTTDLLQAALRAAGRGSTLTRHLLAFARRQHLEPRPVDVAAAVDGVARMLGRTIGPGIRLVVHAETDLPPAWIDPNQLELVILNLALNARDAMPDGGILRIDAGCRGIESGGPLPDLVSGDSVVISVSDTGIGMNSETLARAFEPFSRQRKQAGAQVWGCRSCTALLHSREDRSASAARLAKGLKSICRFHVQMGRRSVMPIENPIITIRIRARHESSSATMMQTCGRWSDHRCATAGMQSGKLKIQPVRSRFWKESDPSTSWL